MSETQVQGKKSKKEQVPVENVGQANLAPAPAEAAKAAKKETVYEDITMADGRVVQFPGTRKVQKTVEVNEDEGWVTVRLDFRNGKSVGISSRDLTAGLILRATGHGLSQKVGDEFSGTNEIDDMVLEAEAMVTQLKGGDWGRQREAGDSMKGASIVIRALVEVSGKTVEVIKKFLDDKLAAAKTRGEKLTRQELYSSFRDPASETGKVIKRLEEEKISKDAKFKASDLLGELAAA